MNERASAVLVLDRALSVLRHASVEQWLGGIAAGLPLAAVLLGLYGFEQMVGGAALPGFALLCALAYWIRFRMLCRLARQLVSQLAPAAFTRQASPPWAWAVELTNAMLAGVGTAVWTVALVVLARGSVAMFVVSMPLLCVRGAFAPSLLARSGCAMKSGLGTLLSAYADTRGVRRLFAGVELLALLGFFALFANLYALTALALLLASSVLGLDVAFVSAFVAPDNQLVLLICLGFSALALSPLQAAISAVAFVTARERDEAADLHAAIDALSSSVRAHAARPRAWRGLRFLLVLGAAAQLAAGARAQSPHLTDARAREHARAILSRREFLSFEPDAEGSSLAAWLDRWLRPGELSDRDASAPPRFEVRLPSRLLVASSSLLLLGVVAWLIRGAYVANARLKRAPARASPRVVEAPTEQLAQAARWASEQAYGAALRSLYGTCLQALVRAWPRNMEATCTNGQLLQRLPHGPLRVAFERLTVCFERSWYGRQPVSRADYEQAHALATDICHQVGQLVVARDLPERQS